MPLAPKELRKKALALLESHPGGMRYTELVREIKTFDPSLTEGQIQGQIFDLQRRFPEEVYKPSRGLFRKLKFQDADTQELKQELIEPQTKITEEDFYEPFREYLVNELEECTRAIVLGGKKFQDKWGTPDVIGKWQSRVTDIVKIETEIVAAEIKTEATATALITAFGQACAYCLFCHKSYLVLPKSAPKEDLDRIGGLCQIFGIGLVLFDASNANDPHFDIRTQARRQQPDMFYVNKNLQRVVESLFE